MHQRPRIGAERSWTEFLPHAGNQMFPTHLYNARDHAAFLFYENDPGVPVPRANDLEYVPDKTATPPEWAWWQFDIDDLTAGKADLMKSLLNATDPDLERFLVRRNGKLLLWHGWNDAGAPPEPTKDYYDAIVAATFGGDVAKARARARLFMFPGMGHCAGGPGPDTSWIRSSLSSRGSKPARRPTSWSQRIRPTAASTTSAASAPIRKSRATAVRPWRQRPRQLDRSQLHLPLAARGGIVSSKF